MIATVIDTDDNVRPKRTNGVQYRRESSITGEEEWKEAVEYYSYLTPYFGMGYCDYML